MDIPDRNCKGGIRIGRAVSEGRCTALLCLLLLALPGLGSADTERCTDLGGRLVSLEGDVRVADRPARTGEEICSGETISVGASSRAAVRLEDTETVVRIDQGSVFRIESTATERSWLTLLRGVVYLFSRQPESLRVDTPYVNAAIDGTEFVITAADELGEITVIEGSVLARNARGEVRLAPGQVAVAPPGERAAAANRRRSSERRPLGAPLPADRRRRTHERRRAREAASLTRHRRRGARACELTRDIAGRRGVAGAAIDDRGDPKPTARGDAARARTQPSMPTPGPGSAIAYTALSYAHQARFDIDQALDERDRRRAERPGATRYALARLAELQLGVDDTGHGARERSRGRPSRTRPTPARAPCSVSSAW